MPTFGGGTWYCGMCGAGYPGGAHHVCPPGAQKMIIMAPNLQQMQPPMPPPPLPGDENSESTN